jgi:hypothetical protein
MLDRLFGLGKFWDAKLFQEILLAGLYSSQSDFASIKLSAIFLHM